MQKTNYNFSVKLSSFVNFQSKDEDYINNFNLNKKELKKVFYRRNW